MSDYEANENGRAQVMEFSLTQAVEEVRQHGFAQIEKLGEKQKTLSSLQATLLEIEKKGQTVELELRSKLREILAKEAGIEHLEQQKKVLNERHSSVSKEKADLQMRVGEAEEDARKELARFSSYRRKMEAHRVAVRLAASQGEARKVLEEKKAFVRELKKKKEELREDLENPNGSTVEKAKREMEALKVEVSDMKKTAAEKRQRLRKETETHVQMKEDTEIQNRRFEAIVRRLHLQLGRAQAAHRQVCDDVRCMERELAELKERL